MKSKLRPLDVIMAHPDTLAKIKVVNDLDRGLLDTINWGFTFHPDEENNTRQLDVCDGVEIDWSSKEGFDDVVDYVKQATVRPVLPVAGLAEHTISLRRLVNAQPETVREGDAWTSGITHHLKDVLGPAS
ncbi:hypothetical protein pEaSNUABM29_00153 [Erwinia phage pEa_SNUABM_29]|nr:hypothetical protein pEaSNUABM29_00153 [Erwinia phage pEa_SNUABM_29]